MASDFQLILPDRPPIGGIARNVPPEAITDGQWFNLDNVVVRNGQLEKVTGWTQQTPTVVGAVGLIRPVRYNSSAVATIVGTNQFLYRVGSDGLINLNQANPFLMSPLDRMDADYLSKKWYFSDQADGLVSWNGVDQVVSENTNGVRGRALSQFKNHLILGNIASVDTNGAYTLAGSSLVAGNSISWDFDNSDSDAIVLEVPEDASQIQTIRRIVDQLAIYKENSIHLLSYQGTTFVYSKQERVTNMGMLARNSLADLGETHLFVGQDNLYGFNGSTLSPFGDRVWKYLMSLVAATGRADIYAFRDQRYKEVIFGFREEGQTTFSKALVYNYEYDCFSFRDWPFSAAGFSKRTVFSGTDPGDLSFDELTHPMDDEANAVQSIETLEDYGILAGTAAGTLNLLDETVATANGTAIVATMETGDTPLGDVNMVKIVNKMLLDVPSQTGTPLQIYVCGRMSLAEDIVWQGPYTMDAISRYAYFMVNGIWLRAKFVKLDGTMVFRGFAWSVRVRGNY